MNRDRVLVVRATLSDMAAGERPDLPTFNMAHYYNVPQARSGTRKLLTNLEAAKKYGGRLGNSSTMCLAALVQILFAKTKQERECPAIDFATQALDLTHSQGIDWFIGSWGNRGYLKDLTIEDAINFLTKMLDSPTRGRVYYTHLNPR